MEFKPARCGALHSARTIRDRKTVCYRGSKMKDTEFYSTGSRYQLDTWSATAGSRAGGEQEQRSGANETHR